MWERGADGVGHGLDVHTHLVDCVHEVAQRFTQWVNYKQQSHAPCHAASPAPCHPVPVVLNPTDDFILFVAVAGTRMVVCQSGPDSPLEALPNWILHPSPPPSFLAQ